MKNKKKLKEIALNLHVEGVPLPKIAKRCNVSLRTIQRWIKEEQEVNLTIIDIDENPDNEDFQPNTIVSNVTTNPASDFSATGTDNKVAAFSNTYRSADILNLQITHHMAIRLLNLTENAMATIEECFTDITARRSDKLKAAQIVGDWVGLSSHKAILSQVLSVCELSADVSVDGAVNLTPKKVVLAKKLQEKKQDEMRRLALEERMFYTDEIIHFFNKNLHLPKNLNVNKFDADMFLEFYEDEKSRYEHAQKLLKERGLNFSDR